MAWFSHSHLEQLESEALRCADPLKTKPSVHPTLHQNGLSFPYIFRDFPYFVPQRVAWLWKKVILLCPSLRLETWTFYWDGAWSSACARHCGLGGQLCCKMMTFQVIWVWGFFCWFGFFLIFWVFFSNTKLHFLELTPKQIFRHLPIIWGSCTGWSLGMALPVHPRLLLPEKPPCSSHGRDPTSPPSAPFSSHPLPLHPTFPGTTS